MKTTSRNRSPRFFKIAGLSFLLVAILLVSVLLRAPVTGLLWRVLTPVLEVRNVITSSQVSELEAELASTTALAADRNVLYAENLDLKARLGRDGSMQVILGDVTMRPPATPYDTLMIDAGSEAGVASGDLVSAGGTTLIGTVAEVYRTAARVVLFSAPGETYQGLLNGETPVSVSGQGEGSMTTEVPAGTAVAVGDPVTFPGIAGGYAGVVSAVSAPSGDSFDTLYLQLPVDPLTLAAVEVWREQSNENQ